MMKSILLFSCLFIVSHLSLSGQELNTISETSKYYPETVPQDVIDIYNEELHQPSNYLPWTSLRNIAELTMSSSFSTDTIVRNRKVIYSHDKNRLIISVEGKNSTSVIAYTYKEGKLTQEMSAIIDGVETPMMKEIKYANENGRLIRKESYFKSDTGWVLRNFVKVNFQQRKNGLLLETRVSGIGEFSSTDSAWYVFDEKGILLKKSNDYNRWNFTYDTKGNIKTIEFTQRDVSNFSEKTYLTTYIYNKEGYPVLRSIEEKYYTTELRLLYDAQGKVVVRTKITRGDNELKEVTSFSFDKEGKLSFLGQTLNGQTTIKAATKCDFNGNIISFEGEQFGSKAKIEFKDGQGSSSIAVEGPGSIIQTTELKMR